MSYNDILAGFAAKWPNLSRRTIDRRITASRKSLAAQYDHIKHEADTLAAKEIDALKLEIMGVYERKSVLTQIARGQIPLSKPMVVDKEIRLVEFVPDWSDRRAAIAELNKMDGDYAPAKVAQTNPDGSKIDETKVVMTDAQLAELKKSIESKK